jgi:hypothetical protein
MSRSTRNPRDPIRVTNTPSLSGNIKLGPEVEAIVAEARARNVWVHMGRVNSLRRLAYAASIGCDSVDGTQWGSMESSCEKRDSAGHPQKIPVGSRSISSSSLAISVVGAVYL